jgi:hypothetical protein
VSLYYGEGVGADDLDIPQGERYLQIVATPIGCLGGARVLWTGNLSILRSYDFSTAVPVEISNPPKREEYKEPGFYIWGEDAQDVINRRYSNEDL